jgi:hypothetical protein
VDDILTRIDNAVALLFALSSEPRCANCHGVLAEDGPSSDWCGDDCQRDWYSAQTTRPEEVYARREPRVDQGCGFVVEGYIELLHPSPPHLDNAHAP